MSPILLLKRRSVPSDALNREKKKNEEMILGPFAILLISEHVNYVASLTEEESSKRKKGKP